MSLTKFNKALGSAVSGVFAWATFVVHSPSAPITAEEWLLLGSAAVTVLVVFGIPNINAPTTIQIPAESPVPVEPAPTEGWEGWQPRPDPGALAVETDLTELDRRLATGELDTGNDEPDAGTGE